METIQDLMKWDIVTPIAKSFGPNGFYFKDGKIWSDKFLQVESPWIHTVRSIGRECGFWHSILFNMYGLLPSPCLNCYKVVVRPRTVKELFQLKDLQVKLDIPSKCGIEKRRTVHGNYGGYFYNDSWGEGVFCYEKVKKAVAEEISEGIPVILKRACTEFEMRFGDSSKWEITQQQKDLEKLLSDSFMRDEGAIEQPKILQARIMMQWLWFAYERGDETYKEFTDGQLMPGIRAYHTYHDEPRGEA